MSLDELRAAAEPLRRRHVEKKSWPSVRNDPNAAADGFIHYCATCWSVERRWPCDVAKLLAALDKLR